MSYGFGRINDLAQRAHEYAVSKGFWNGLDPTDVYVRLGKLALITEEVGEAVSAVRKDDRENLAQELADIVIRVMDLAEASGLNLEQAIVDKMEKNSSRPQMHGKLA